MNAPLPCPSWCEADHALDGADRTHRAQVGPFSGPSQVVIIWFQTDQDGRRLPAHPRLAYLVEGQKCVMDVEPDDAHDWAHIIGGLDARGLSEFPRALLAVFKLMGGDDV